MQALEARQRGDWDKALVLLRRWGKHIPPALLSYLRGSIWYAAGEPAAAAAFFEHASRLEPANEHYQALLLHTLKAASPAVAASRAEAVLQESESRSPAVVVHAANVIFGATKELSDIDSLPIYKRLIPVLERTLANIDTTEDIDKPALAGMAISLLATCYKDIGDTQKAYTYYSRGIQLDPRNDAVLVARGILTYGADPSAITDFEQAVRLGSPLVWPYFFLAHHYLGSNRFEESRLMSEQGLQRPANARVQSELYEFLAISLAGLGFPEPLVRRAFESSLRANACNDRARRNLDRFDAALAARTAHRDWERVSDSSMRRAGQQASRWDPAFNEQRQLVPA